MIRQRNTNDCGVAALAMFLGVTYEQAVAFCTDIGPPGWTPETPTSELHLLYAAAQAGHDSAQVVRFIEGVPAIVAVQSVNFEKSQHAVYWDGAAVFDPSLQQVIEGRDMMIERSESFIYRIVDLCPGDGRWRR